MVDTLSSLDALRDVLVEYTLPCSAPDLISRYLTQRWTHHFLATELQDIGVNVTSWELDPEEAQGDKLLTREVVSSHKSKVSFPGLASHALNKKRQVLRVDREASKAVLYEVTSFSGIPLSDCFVVNMRWAIDTLPPVGYKPCCRVRICVEVSFIKSTWLKGTIISNTKSELLEVCEQWRASIAADVASGRATWTAVANDALSIVALWECEDKMVYGDEIESTSQFSQAQLHQSGVGTMSKGSGYSPISFHSDAAEMFRNTDDAPGDSLADHPPSMSSTHSTTSRNGSMYESDDDGEFYDCIDEETGLLPGSTPALSYDLSGTEKDRTYGAQGNNYSGYINNHNYHGALSSRDGHVASGPTLRLTRSRNSSLARLADAYCYEESSNESNQGGNSDDSSGYQGGARLGGYRSSVVAMLDVIFLLSEYLAWQLTFWYRSELREMFDISDTSEIAKRVFLSVIPSATHTTIMIQPDLYGPVLCVMTLPLVLVLSIDAAPAASSGCSRTLLLGQASIVSISLWLGMTVVFRVVSYLAAPSLRLTHLACALGYSYTAYALALGLSAVIEASYGISTTTRSSSSYGPWALHPAMPLLLIGLPAAVSMGSLFWSQTAETSPSTLMAIQETFRSTRLYKRCCALDVGTQTARSAASSGSSLSALSIVCRVCDRRWPRQAWLACKMIASQITLMVPKLLVFLIITGTHYECLWYLAHVFMPGRRHMCSVSKELLLSPSTYADILVQKELIKYASELIRSGSVPKVS